MKRNVEQAMLLLISIAASVTLGWSISQVDNWDPWATVAAGSSAAPSGAIHSPALTTAPLNALTSSSLPVTEEESANWLRQRAAADSTRVDQHLEQWILIVSSKQVGTIDGLDLVFPGVPYTNRMIVDNFEFWLGRYPDALLADSGSYSSHASGWWIVLIPRPQSDSTQASGWCRSEGLTPDNCKATRVSRAIVPSTEK